MSVEVIIEGNEVVKMNMRPTITLVEPEKDDLLEELSKVAKEIRQLRVAFDLVNANKDPLTFDRIMFRLDAAEQEYFLLFNQYRVVSGFKPLEGKKFTGYHRYESVLF